MRALIILLLVLSLLGCAKEPIEKEILQSMGRLDSFYIPVLVFSNLQKGRETELAMDRFVKQWKKFDQKYSKLQLTYGLDIKDKEWSADFLDLDSSVLLSQQFFVEGDLIGMYQQLQKIRQVLAKIRQRHGWPYFLDNLTLFHESMDQIVIYLRGKDELTDRDRNKLRELFRAAQSSLLAAENAELPNEVFGFDEEKVAAIKKRVREEQRLLAAFAAALSKQNADGIFQTATELKPNFIVLLKAFGDFQPIFDQVVKERKNKEEEKNEE
ncbi:MAG: hypothetical protein ABIE84_06405 [bacterium]